MCLAEISISGAGLAGTVSSALVALPRHARTPAVFLHADGPPDQASYLPVPASADETMPPGQAQPVGEQRIGSTRQPQHLALLDEAKAC